MKILALDIGAGTEDVLLYDSEKNLENCLKMVLPSPTQVFATKVREATRLHQDLFIKGDIIGGGAFSSVLRTHVRAGCRVVMTENAAYTIRNDLEEVKEKGIEITQTIKPETFNGKTITLEEVNINKLKACLENFNESLYDVDIVAVAVQDHGISPKGMSNRRFRIQKMKELLAKKPVPESLAFRENDVPPYFLRMKSAVEATKRQLPESKALVMDTAPAAVLGCLTDATIEEDPVLAINVGNGHTMAAIIVGGEIRGLLEHHTRALNPQRIENIMIDFMCGTLTNDDVFESGGHGLFWIDEPLTPFNIKEIVATGPNRSILAKTNLRVNFVAPAGDVMMTGPMGLVKATERKICSIEDL